MLNKTESLQCLSLNMVNVVIPLEFVINLNSQLLIIGYHIDLLITYFKTRLSFSLLFDFLNIWFGTNNQRLCLQRLGKIYCHVASSVNSQDPGLDHPAV